MTSLVTWNIRGLNDPNKQSEIKSLIRKKNLSMVNLIETKVSGNNIDQVRRRISASWSLASNINEAPYGRILSLWDPSIF